MFVPRQQYARELKIATMRELDSGKSMAEVARAYQVNPNRLWTWRGEWRAKGEMAFPGHAHRPEAKLDAERIPELERKIGQQAMEIDFLKKALRHFREQPPPVVVNGATGSTSKIRQAVEAEPRKSCVHSSTNLPHVSAAEFSGMGGALDDEIGVGPGLLPTTAETRPGSPRGGARLSIQMDSYRIPLLER